MDTGGSHVSLVSAHEDSIFALREKKLNFILSSIDKKILRMEEKGEDISRLSELRDHLKKRLSSVKEKNRKEKAKPSRKVTGE